MAEEKARQAAQAEAAARQAESSASGAVNASVYWAYFRAGANPFLIFLALVSAVWAQALYQYTDFWLSAWTEDYKPIINETTNEPIYPMATAEKEMPKVIIYTCLTLVLFFSAFLRMWAIFSLCLRSATNLHNRIFSRLLRAPMTFFEVNNQ